MGRILIEEILEEHVSLTAAHFRGCKKELQSCSRDGLILKSTQLQSTEICSAMKQHWTWLASLLSPNSNKGTLFLPADSKHWHIFSGRHLLGLEELREYSRGGHSDPVNLREPPWLFLIPAFSCSSSAQYFTDSTDASCSPGKSHKRMFRHIP